MIKTRIRKILRDVLARKGRTALVSIAIFIGVTGTITLFSMSDILVSQLRADIQEEELAMYRLYITLTRDAELDDAAYIEALEALPEVTEVLGAITPDAGIFGYFKVDPEDERFETAALNAFHLPYTAADGSLGEGDKALLPIEPMRLIEGAFPQEGAGEIAIEQRMAERYEIGVGDTLHFRILTPDENGELGKVEPRTISGIVFHPYTFSASSGIYTFVDDANYMMGTRGFNTILIRTESYPEAQAALEKMNEFANFTANNSSYIPVFTQNEDPAQNSLITGVQQISSLLGFLALVSLVVSGFLVINVISSLVLEQKRQIGVMKSLGASRRDNFMIYSGIAFVYGLIGVIPGVILGIPFGQLAAEGLASTANTVVTGFNVSVGSVILGILVGLLVPVLASILPVFLGTRVTILEAMTDLGIDANYGNGPIAKLIGRLPIPITVRQGLSNISLKKSRLAFTVITLSIAVGVFMGIFALFSSLTSGINQFLDIFNVQVLVGPVDARSRSEFEPILEANFRSNEDPSQNIVRTIEPGINLLVQFEGYEPLPTAGGPPGIFAYGYDAEAEGDPNREPAFRVEIDSGQNLYDYYNSEEYLNTPVEERLPGVIFSSSLARNFDNKQIGDVVTMKTLARNMDVKIVGISDFPLDQLWSDWESLAIATNYTVGAPRPNEYLTSLNVEGLDTPLAALGVDDQVGGFLPFDEGAFLTQGQNEVVISDTLAEANGYSVGDTLSLSGLVEGEGQAGDYTIAGIFSIPPMMAAQAGDQIPEGGFIALNWTELAALEGRSLEGEPAPGGYFLITTLEDPTADELQIVLDDITEKLLDSGIPTQGFNFVSLTDQISQGFITVQLILQAVAGLIALVGALGLLTTLSMSVFERQKEIGVMRSIGARSGTIAAQFLTEGMVVGFIAWLLGLPLAYFIQYILLEITDFSETFPLEFSPTAAIVGLVGMLIITLIASLWPSLSAANKTVSDILRYQ